MTREYLRAALSPNGHRVHLASKTGRAVCGSKIIATCFVRARITCATCAEKRPAQAKRRSQDPHVVGVDWSPLYAALRRALVAGETEHPKVKVGFWPILAASAAS